MKRKSASSPAAIKNPLKSTAGTGCAILFLFPFAAFGLFMAGWTVWSLCDYGRMQSWVETTATITSLEEKRGDGTTGIEATYRYEYAGQTYEGDRVAIHAGSDNISSFQNRLLRKLQSASKAERPVPCYVNPSSPDEAVLNRDARPGMMIFKGVFGLIFGGVGVGGYVGMWFARKSESKKSVKQQDRPDEPWTWNENWRDGVIESSQGYGVIAMACFTAFWNAISWPVAIMFAMSDEKKEWFVPWLISLFPIVGTGLAIATLVMFVRWRRFRGNYFRLASVPGVIGGKLAGVVFIPRQVNPTDGFHLRLRCVRTDNDGENSTEHTLWEHEKLIARTLDSGEPGETAIPVSFTIPSSASETNDDRDIKWTLECKAQLPGPNLDLVYEVPVFHTADSRDDIEADEDDLLSDYEATETLAASLARQGIRMERGHHPDEVVFRTPPARNLGTAAFLTLFSTIWVGVCVGMWSNEMWIFASVFSLFAMLMVPMTFSLWLSTSVLTIRDDRWQVRSGWWPLLLKSVEFTAADIEAFTLHSNMSSGNKKWNNLQVKLRNKKKPMTLSKGLASRRVEQIWIDDLKQRAGLLESQGAESQEGLDLSRGL